MGTSQAPLRQAVESSLKLLAVASLRYTVMHDVKMVISGSNGDLNTFFIGSTFFQRGLEASTASRSFSSGP